MIKPSSNTGYAQLRRLLIEARHSAGLTQAELAAALSRPQSYVSKYERGERRLDVIEFLEVAQTIGLDPGEVLKQLGDLRGVRQKADTE